MRCLNNRGDVFDDVDAGAHDDDFDFLACVNGDDHYDDRVHSAYHDVGADDGCDDAR